MSDETDCLANQIARNEPTPESIDAAVRVIQRDAQRERERREHVTALLYPNGVPARRQ